MSQYDPKFDMKINIDHYDYVGHEVKVSMTYISWSSDFALYLEDCLCMYIILREYESVRPDV